MAPSRAAVYGYVGTNATGRAGIKVEVTVASSSSSSSSSSSYTVEATVDDSTGAWKALLHPTRAGGTYTITAACVLGCTGIPVVLHDVTFGSVWFCAGQSNMALPVQFTYARNDTISRIKSGGYWGRAQA